MKFKINDESLLVLSSGLLAGVGTTISFVGVPAMLAAKDPLPVWKVMYNRGKNLALTTIGLSTIIGLRCFFRKDDWRYLLVSGMTFSFIPYTIFAMMSTNQELLKMIEEKKTGEEEDGKARKLVKKWDKLQYFRTFLGLGAFVTSVAIIHGKK